MRRRVGALSKASAPAPAATCGIRRFYARAAMIHAEGDYFFTFSIFWNLPRPQLAPWLNPPPKDCSTVMMSTEQSWLVESL
jgi:hypothetical protein